MSSLITLSAINQFGAGAAPGPTIPITFKAGYEYSTSIYTALSHEKRIALAFNYGYGIFSLSNPSSPTALVYEDMETDIPVHADGQSYLRTLAVAPDGSKIVVATDGGQSIPFGTVVGATSGNIFTLKGDFHDILISSLVIQQISGRTIAYISNGYLLSAIDITTLPSGTWGPSAAGNMTEEKSTIAAYTGLSLTGNYVVYTTSNSGPKTLTSPIIGYTDVSSPGSIGHITSSFVRNTLSLSDFNCTLTETLLNFSAIVDPTDTSALYVLAEFNNKTWTLLRVKGSTKTIIGSFTIPILSGETWSSSYSSGLISNNNDVYVLMLGHKQGVYGDSTKPDIYRLFTTTVTNFNTTPSIIDLSRNDYSLFSNGHNISGFASSDGKTLYTYIPTGSGAYAITLNIAITSSSIPPSSPTNVTAIKINDTTVRVAWTTPTSDGGSAITSYTITPRNVTTGALRSLISTPIIPTSFDVTGLPTGNTYNFDIVAVNGIGSSSSVTSPSVVLGTTVTLPSSQLKFELNQGNGVLVTNNTVPADVAGLYTGTTGNKVATIFSTNTDTTIGTYAIYTAKDSVNNFYVNQRIFLAFDTELLGSGATINNVQLLLTAKADHIDNPPVFVDIYSASFADSLVPFQSNLNATTLYSDITGIKITSLTFSSWPTTTGDWTTIAIPFPSSSFGLINKSGLTKLALKSSLDTNGVTPTGSNLLSGQVGFDTTTLSNYTLSLLVDYTPSGTGGPSTPTGLTVVSQDTALALTWVAPAGSVSKYVVGIKNVEGGAEEIIDVPSANTSYTIPNLFNHETYEIRILAGDSSGNVSQFSNVVYGTPGSNILGFPLQSWTTFNSAPVYPTIPYKTFYGIGNITKTNSSDDLFVTPQNPYPAFGALSSATIRLANRRKTVVVNTASLETWSQPPQINLANDNQVAYGTLSLDYGVDSPINPIDYPHLMWDRSATAGDISKIYKDYIGYFNNDAHAAFTVAHAFADGTYADRGQQGQTMWYNNYSNTTCVDGIYSCVMPGWSINYAQIRPFLLFDTSVVTSNTTILSVNLKFNLSVIFNDTYKNVGDFNIVNEDSITVNFHKASLASHTNLNSTDYNSYDHGAPIGTLNISGSDFLAQKTISVTLNKSVLQLGDWSKIVMTTSLDDTTTLPTGWNQFTIDNILLEVIVDPSTLTVPSGPTNVQITPGNAKAAISWSAPANDGGANVNAYVIVNKNTGQVSMFDASATSATIPFLQNGTLYTFEIVARNSQGFSSEVFISATPNGVVSVPAAPASISAVPSNGLIYLSWTAPTDDGGSPITNYIINNNTDATQSTVAATVSTKEFDGLTNGTPYTLTVCAVNAAGSGLNANVIATPSTAITIPTPPVIYNVGAGDQSGSVSWSVPVTNGGSAILSYAVVLYATNGSAPQNFTVVAPAGYFSLVGLTNGVTYHFTVAATNSIGTGPVATSFDFVPSSDVAVVGGSLPKVPIDYNYNNFYRAPVDLNPKSATYLDYLYPEIVQVTDNSYALSGTVNFPVNITTDNNILYLVIGGKEYDYTLPVGKYYLALTRATHQLTGAPQQLAAPDVLNQSFFGSVPPDFVFPTSDNPLLPPTDLMAFGPAPWKAVVVGDSLELVYNESGLTKTIAFPDLTTKPNQANTTLFGSDYTVVAPVTRTLVENHVPTSEYDSINLKALVESRVWTSVRNKDFTPLVVPDTLPDPPLTVNCPVHHAGKYMVQLPNTIIKPNGVTVSYIDDTNSTIYLRDYFGDGRLLLRLRTQSLPGDPVITTFYPKDGCSYGEIDYETGLITQLQFPTIIDVQTGLNTTPKKTAIFGKNAKFPIRVLKPSFLYINRGSTKLNFTIPATDPSQPVGYSAQEIVNYLMDTKNSTGSLFALNGLSAGTINGQLWVRLNELPPASYGPDKTISLNTEVGNTNSLNYALFGPHPIIYTTSKIYIDYAYSSNDPSPYHYIWYQTPHFELLSKGNTSQHVTKANIDYLLDRLDRMRPSSTVLNSISFDPDIQEQLIVRETWTTNVATNVTFPYIFVNGAPEVPASIYAGNVGDVEVSNPDEQFDILVGGYTFLK